MDFRAHFQYSSTKSEQMAFPRRSASENHKLLPHLRRGRGTHSIALIGTRHYMEDSSIVGYFGHSEENDDQPT